MVFYLKHLNILEYRKGICSHTWNAPFFFFFVITLTIFSSHALNRFLPWAIQVLLFTSNKNDETIAQPYFQFNKSKKKKLNSLFATSVGTFNIHFRWLFKKKSNLILLNIIDIFAMIFFVIRFVHNYFLNV